jgi:phage gpG-like protein
MTQWAVTHNTNDLIARIQETTKNLAPSSPRLNEALTRIGLYVTSVAKMNARKKGLIDTGRLINSIRYEFFKEGNTEGIQVGSFNVPYARVHEFGFRGVMNIPAHERLGYAVRAHTRRVNYRERAYIRPALATSRTFIIDTLRAALLFANNGGR